jgi:hypothetical protein
MSAVQFFELKHKDGTGELVQFAQLVLNDNQQIALYGFDFNKCGGLKEMSGSDDVEYQHIGKLSDQSFIFQMQIANSLKMEAWSFRDCPNPEIVLMSKKNE